MNERIKLSSLTELALLTMFTLVGCGPPTSPEIPQNSAGKSTTTLPLPRVLRRGLPGEPRTLDPQLADDTFSFQVIRDMYEGLTAEARDGAIEPAVASSWTVDASGTQYLFSLRPDARWSDGTKVLASEFVDGLRRAVDPNTASGSADLLLEIKGASNILGHRALPSTLGVTAEGDRLLRIQLERPAPFILQILAQPIASPLHHSTPNTDIASKPSITNGPYVLQRRVPNSLIQLRRNSFYWDASHVEIETVNHVNAESEATELREYEAGDLDMTFTIPSGDFKRLSQSHPTEVRLGPILATLYLALNLADEKFADNKALREALSIAVDRELIAKEVIVGATPAYSLVPPEMPGYVTPLYFWSKWTRDHQLEYAKSLFQQAGYSDAHKLRLRLYCNQDEGIRRVMTAVAASWRQNLGVETQVTSDEFRVFLDGRKDKRRWDVARLGWNADYADPSSFLNIFALGSEQNDPSYSSTEFNQLIGEARVQPDPVKRLAILKKSEEVMLGDYPIVPIYFYRARRLVKPWLGGVEITLLDHTYSKHLFWKRVL